MLSLLLLLLLLVVTAPAGDAIIGHKLPVVFRAPVEKTAWCSMHRAHTNQFAT